MPAPMKSQDFDFFLPHTLIAQAPVSPRDQSKLLICKSKGTLSRFTQDFIFSDHTFFEIENELNSNDLLIVNEAKVLPVRLLGSRADTGGAVELLITRFITTEKVSAILHLSSKVKIGMKLTFEPGLTATLLTSHEERLARNGEVEVEFSGAEFDRLGLEKWLESHGHVPLPPYIERADEGEDKKNYQTVYASKTGSAAAPTAGFHFTDELLKRLHAKGVEFGKLHLNIGIGTFRPIKTENIDEHPMHEEIYTIDEMLAQQIQNAHKAGKRIVAVGTTSVRALESWAHEQNCKLGTFTTKIYIKPGFKFKIVQDLITNFHLPKSTLLVLIAAAIGIDWQKKAYDHAIKNNYRFFSYGDSMFIRGIGG